MKLGNKSGIVGLLMAWLGVGGAVTTGLTGEQAAATASPPAPSVHNIEALETLEEAVNKLGSTVQAGQFISQQVADEARATVREAQETAVSALGVAREELRQTGQELGQQARHSLQEMMATAASGLAGLVGSVLAALGFRRSPEEW
jgi:hypothetical protein